jgi:catechol 2,3-dioxygenase-like lactoylglutathione lyase family enzyme
MSAAFEYVEIGVSDVGRSARWYEEMLGLRPGADAIRLVAAGDGPSGWIDDNRQRGVRHYRDRLGFEVVGQLFFEDEQEFVITYLQGGENVLELFSYGVPTLEPWRMDGDRLGVRALGLAADPHIPARDPDGVRLAHAG